MTVNISSPDNLEKIKRDLLSEYKFFLEHKKEIAESVNSNSKAIDESYRHINALVKKDLDDVDPVVKLDVALENLNTRIAMAYLNDVEAHELNLKYLTRLPGMFFKLHLNKLKILKKLKIDGEKCHIIHLSPDIRLLIDLKELDLSGCSLDKVPSAIAELTNLEILILNHNKLIKLPDDLGELEHLHKIQAHHNKLREFPNGIDALSELEELDLHDNKITELPKKMLNMSALKHLNIKDNPITDIPEEFKRILRKK